MPSADEDVPRSRSARAEVERVPVRDERFRRRGIGKALVAALADLAHNRGCYGMWVLTDSDNSAAIRTYKSAAPVSDHNEPLMLSWRLDDAHQTSTDGTAQAGPLRPTDVP